MSLHKVKYSRPVTEEPVNAIEFEIYIDEDGEEIEATTSPDQNRLSRKAFYTLMCLIVYIRHGQSAACQTFFCSH